jgi:glycosyltransferase involved in cell wall biosynthesis
MSAGASGLGWTIATLGFVLLISIGSVLRRRGMLGASGAVLPGAHVVWFGRYPLDAGSGNAIAIRRAMRGLRARGVETSYVGPDDDLSALERPPTICHALHAGEPATRAAEAAERAGAALVVTVTGTDLARVDDEVRRNLARADAVVCLAAEQVDAVQAIAPAARTLRIEQGPDDELFAQAASQGDPARLRARFGLDDETHVAVMLGGLRPVKAQLLALDAMKVLGGRRDEAARSWRLVIVGDELDAGYAAEVRARAASLPSVVLAGALAHGDALTVLASADALVNSSDSEGESRAILEAQSIGTPVVARRNAGNAALVEDGRSGRLFDDARGLADALEFLATDPESAQRMRAGAAERLAARGSVETEIDAHIDLYRSLEPGRHVR